MQSSQAARDQAMQALRVGRRQEEEGLQLDSIFTFRYQIRYYCSVFYVALY